MKWTVQFYSVQFAVLMYAYLWNHYCSSESAHVYHSHNFPSAPLSFYPALLCLTPSQATSVLVSVIIHKFAFLRILYKWNNSVCTFFCLNSFIQHDYSEIHPCHSIYQQFIPFLLLRSTPWHSYTTVLPNHSLLDEHLGCFQCSTIINRTVIILTQVFV